ncbi:MAG: hypothetical protein HXY45_06160 [Syntrophaceae bacterium]|nr:hypothetical protein [Syntrophaceae bacterium]
MRVQWKDLPIRRWGKLAEGKIDPVRMAWENRQDQARRGDRPGRPCGKKMNRPVGECRVG